MLTEVESDEFLLARVTGYLFVGFLVLEVKEFQGLFWLGWIFRDAAFGFSWTKSSTIIDGFEFIIPYS